MPFRVQPARSHPTPGAEIRIDQFVTLLRQGRVQSATILTAEKRITGSFDRGQYWLAYSDPLLVRLESVLDDAGVPVMHA